MQKVTLIFFLALFSSVICAPHYGILYSDYIDNVVDVQKKLIPLLGSNVTLWNVQSNTPTWDQLNAFDAVLVYSSFVFADAVTLGNLLAQYVDSGLFCYVY
jgi:hypothetical protein